MKKALKIGGLVALGIAGIVVVLFGAIALKVFVIGEVKDVNSIYVNNVNVEDTLVQFDMTTPSSADVYQRYGCRTEGDCLYVKIHTVIAGGLGSRSFEQHLKITGEFGQINKIYLEDGVNKKFIWER